MLFGDILNSIPTGLNTKPIGYSDVQTQGNLDILYHKISRTNIVAKNKMLDFLVPESDKNFLREKQLDKLNTLIGKLSVSSQLLGMVQTQLFIAKVSPYFPESMRYVLKNFQGLLDSGANMLQDIKAGSTYSALGNALFVDLLSQYSQGNVTFNNLLTISQNVADYFIYKPPIQNNVIRSLLSLGLDKFLPLDYKAVLFDNLQYADLLFSVFGEDTFADTYTNRLKELTGQYTKAKINTMVNPNHFQSNIIQIEDPLGLEAESSFVLQLSQNYAEFIQNAITNDPILTQANLTTEQQEEVVQYFNEAYPQLIKSSCGVGITTPDISLVSNGIEIEAKNKIAEVVKEVIERVSIAILSNLKVNKDESLSTFDFLQNIKRNIERRNGFKTKGITNEKLKELDAYFVNLFGKKYTEKDIEELYKKIEEILK